MIEYIKGQSIEVNPSFLIIENNGIAYFVNISLNTFTHLQNEQNKEIRIYTHQIIKEDAHLLFGFAKKEEREIFRHLISVSGVGPNTARIILSSLSNDEIITAIAQENVGALKHVKGIGEKTAQRIIIDLKDKIIKIAIDTDNNFDKIISQENQQIKQEAISALTILGFNKVKIEKTISQIIKENPNNNIEDIVKQALKIL